MDKVNSLINTSVADAKSTLECMLNKEPKKAKELAEKALDKLPLPMPHQRNGQMTRIAMLRTIVRKADKQLLATSK
ncbi:conserved hypothetical protein [Vibrio aestuarianus]|nr:conserved hypothetical protein [Vibrio aestuarianus]